MEKPAGTHHRPETGRPWHAFTVNEAFAAFQTGPEGLTEEEARRRLLENGPNTLANPKKKSLLVRFASQFNNILIYVLILSAAVTAKLGHAADTAVIAGVVLINAVIGLLQEGKAERALDAIRKSLSPTAWVIRGGAKKLIDAGEVVRGDVVWIRPGDKVAADLRLFDARGLFIEEAALTGESEPVEKGVAPAPENAPLGDRRSMAHSMTLVTQGEGLGIAAATGADTEIGKIGAILDTLGETRTPLLKKLDQAGRLIALMTLVLSALTFALGYFLRGYGAGEMFIAAVAIAVAAIPEGLPAVLTITLALGVRRMAGMHAIIRRLPAVESLGSVTVICTDKTGTLTMNKMSVVTLITPDGEELDLINGLVPEEKHIALLAAGIVCGEAASITKEAGVNPTERALLAAAGAAGLDAGKIASEHPRIDHIPFLSEKRFMATLNGNGGKRLIFIKGAPEKILAACADGPARQTLELMSRDSAGKGMRIIAAAVKESSSGADRILESDLDGGFTPLGLFGLIDPPSPDAVRAVGECIDAGIRVVMITGDHARTAEAVAAKIGITGGRTLTGADVEDMNEGELALAIAETSVFARSSPVHKLRIVEALQKRGEVVAMTGDGVNDSPALKKADVGIAMGNRGTEAAKEASEMVLADDNFAAIAHAVREGRTVYDNIRKAILFILPVNVAEGLIVVTAIALGMDLPITPVQILWVNMVSAVTLSLALSFEPAEKNVMKRPPRDPAEPILTGFLLWRVLFVSLISMAAAFGAFALEEAAKAPTAYARTAAVDSLIVFQCFYLMNARRLYSPSLGVKFILANRHALGSVAVILILQLLFTYAPPMQALFGTVSLDLFTWLRIIAASLAGFVLIELEKKLISSRKAP